MESFGEANKEGIDASVGGLVWVRRRNGSWWPGRILHPNELPESCLVSPRSGTPVKLLGREDASVDWYNLEKSIRVKAFRCGEYDDCIEKAKACAANSPKKAVRYARREDAILHALEIESTRQGKGQLDFCSRMEKQAGEHNGVKESPTKYRHEEETNATTEESRSSEDNLNSVQELSQSGVSFEEPNHINVFKEQSVHGRPRRTPNDSEDDGIEGSKRMRGLEDLGMGVVSSWKRKRSQVAHVQEFLKRKNRRRTLAKVLESTAMVSVPVMCEQHGSPSGSSFVGVSGSKVTGLDWNESKKSFSMAIKNYSNGTGVPCENGNALNASEHGCDISLIHCKQKENKNSIMSELLEGDSSDKLFDVPFVGEEENYAGFSPLFVSCVPLKPQVGAGAQSSQSSQVETVSLENVELNESGSTSSDTADDINNVSKRMEESTSKWQLKGKRNSRPTNKARKQVLIKSIDVDDGSSQKVDCNPMGGSVTSSICTYQAKSRLVTETEIDEFQGWSSRVSLKELCMRGPIAEVPTHQRLLPYRQSRFTVSPKYESSDFPLRNYNAGSSLYEVNLEVNASYHPQHVPYISLMSKSNSQPITGHPLTVEVLADGYCDLLLSGSECYSSSCELDEDVNDLTFAPSLQCVDMAYVKRPDSNGRIPTKQFTLQSHISPKKSPKSRKNVLSCKKMRKLSSLTGSQGQHEEDKKPMVDKLKGPAIACVPLKVVFSRINATLNSSTRPAHIIATSSKL